MCKTKAEKKWCAHHHYWHAGIVATLSWLVVWDLKFWWCAVFIGITHFVIDICKSYHKESILLFVTDQIMHILIIASVSFIWCLYNEWNIPFGFCIKYVVIAVAIIACWKPSNIFIKLILKQYSVNVPEEQANDFNAGALIGTIERWLILIFVYQQHYEALGLMIAAKSIIRFSDKATAKTEYVLAGTLLSLFIAILAGLMICRVR